jgi:hypothetical protein
MLMKGIGGALLVAVLLASACSWKGAAQSPEETPPEWFPLSAGTTWVYKGTTKWTQSDSGEVAEKPVTWKMQVLETLTRAHVTAATVKGYPLDLAHFEESKAPGDYLIVRVGTSKYYLLRPNRVEEALRRLRDENDLLGGLVREDEIILDAPLVPGKIFGETNQITRQDRSYSWIVEDVRPADLRGIKGVAPDAQKLEYEVRQRTLPDHQIVTFVPGIGITHYVYGHHGTVSETDVKLVEFHRGENGRK